MVLMCDYVDVSKKQLKLVENELFALYPNFRIRCVQKYKNRMSCHFSFNGVNKHSQVSKLLLETTLGRVLEDHETVDHIDGDSLNDSIDNLQLLSRAENAKKGPSLDIKKRISERNSISQSNNPNIRGEKCNLHKLTETEVREIKNAQLGYVIGSGQDRKLAEKYNVTRGTIAQIRANITWKHI